MLKLSQEKQVALWHNRIESAKEIRETRLAPDFQERLENWRGKYWVQEDLGHKVSVNVVRGITSLIIPAIYYQDPRVQCQPRRPGDERNAMLTEEIINYFIEELDLCKQVRRLITDALIFDIGYAKLGYEIELDSDLEFLFHEDTGEVLPDGNGNPFLRDSKGGIYILRDGKPVQVMEKDGELVMVEQEHPTLNEFIRKEQPYAIRWSPFDFLRDPEGRYADLSDSRWIAFEAEVPLEEVQNNPFYKNTSDLEASSRAAESKWTTLRNMWEKDPIDDHLKRVRIYEVWHKEYNKAKQRYEMWQSVVAEGSKKYLLHRRSPYLAEGFPVAPLCFDEDPESPYGSSPLRAIDDQINTMNIARAQQVAHREQHNQRFVANTQFINKEEAEMIAKGMPGDVATVDSLPAEIPIENVFHALPVPAISPDIYNDYNLAWEEIQRVIGLSDYQWGGSGKVRQATEANLIQGSYNVRIEEKQVIVGKLVQHIARFWIQILKQFGTYEQALRITNQVGQEEWVQFKVQDVIPDDLTVRIDVYQSSFQSKEVREKQASDRYNLLRKDPLVNPFKLIEDVFKASGITDPQAYFNQMPMMTPPPDGSVVDGGGSMDTNQLREPAPTDGGATGRALQ